MDASTRDVGVVCGADVKLPTMLLCALSIAVSGVSGVSEILKCDRPFSPDGFPILEFGWPNWADFS